ncbi:MAG TPA: TonB-dependent receptor [Rhodanobacter sp.]
MKLRYSALYVALATVLASGAAFAAGQDVATKDRSPNTKNVKNLNAIQVSATKTDTPLQKTPVAVSVIGAETLEKEHVMTVQDITKMVPGFEATTEGDHGVITMTMRGIGNDSAKTEYADPEVALFVDGIYTPRAEAAASLLLDMDNVQVMRGPQGTLWGRNSTVGAVNFITAKPDTEGGFNGNAQINIGNYNHVGTRAAVNLPISNTFALRVAVAQEKHDGYTKYQQPGGQLPSEAQQRANYLASGGVAANFQPINLNDYVTGGDEYNAQDQSAARLSALWKPNDRFTWNLSFEYFRDRGTPGMNLMQQPRAGQKFWSALIDTAPYLDRNSKTFRSRMDYDFNDAMELSYIAGYQDYSGKSTYDQDGGAILPTSFTTGGVHQEDRTNDSNYRSFSHELDLKSKGENTVDWILGLYYAAEDNNIRFDIPQINGTSQGTIAWQGSFVQPKETVHSEAAFGQATWNFGDSYHLTGGFRYSHDLKKNIGGINWGWDYDPDVPQVGISPGVTPGPGTGFSVSNYNTGTYSNSNVTWLTRLSKDVGQSSMIYASVSTGYKAGGVQDGGAPYKGESLTNFEIGAKTSFLDGRITWNSDIYYERFKDLQLSAPITYPNGAQGLGFSNVSGLTKVLGAETEVNAQLGHDDRLQLVASVTPEKKLGTLHYAGSNDYQGLPACAPSSGIANCIDISGNQLAHAPDFTFTAVYEHDFHLPNGGTLTPRFSGQYQTSSWLSPYNLGEGDKQGAYFRGDASLRYQDPKGNWWANAYVQNFTDGRVRTNAMRFLQADGSLTYLSQYLAPRTYGIEVGFWF